MHGRRWSAIRVADVALPLLLLLTLLAAPGCAESALAPAPEPGEPPVTVTRIDIGQPSLSLRVGAGHVLSAVARGSDGTTPVPTPIHWSSSDTAVAAVDASGALTARGVGTATITASAGGRQARLEVSVAPANTITRVEIAPGTITLEPRKGVKLTPRVHLSDGTVVTGWPAEWKTSDETVVFVWPDGSISGIRGGTATVRGTVNGVTGEATVTVTEWDNYRLAKVNEVTLPYLLRDSVWSEGPLVTKRRRVQVVSGVFGLSTREQTYQEEITLRSWEETHSVMLGSPVVTSTAPVTTVYRDSGTAGWDAWGYRRFVSTRTPGLVFSATWDPDRHLNTAQVLGETGFLSQFRFER